MSDADYFKEKLLEEKELLLEELKGISVKDTQSKSNWDPVLNDEIRESADKNTGADRFEEFEERLGVSDALEVRLKNINEALTRIEDGKYGVCSEGGEKIEEDRLKVNPAASTCKEHMS